MATTTRQLIRESQAGFITGLRASQLSSYPFKQYKLLQRFEDWCEANPAACMRHFWIRSNADEEVLAGDQISEEIQNTIEIVVAYPLDNRFGLDGVQGLQDVIDQDYRKIDSVVGFKGYGNYIAGHNLCQLESSTVDEGENVWFLRMTYLINYRQSVNLGVQQIIARITGLATVSCSARKVSAIAASITGSASMSARLAYSTSAAITGSGSMTCAIASGPNQLLSFDLSTTNPATSWTSGRTGFSSAYASNEWTVTSTAYSGGYAGNVGAASLVNTGGLTSQTANGLSNGTDLESLSAWEGLDSGDYLECDSVSVGDPNGSDVCVRIVFRSADKFVSNGYLCAKSQAGGGNPGWDLLTNSAGYVAFRARDGVNSGTATLSANYADGAWHYITAWFDESTGQLAIKSDLESEVTAASSVSSPASTDALCISALYAGHASGNTHQQVAYVGVCVGANAQAMYDETFWQHASDPTSLLTTATRNCAITVPVAGDGTVATFGVDQLAIGKPSALTTGYALALNDNSTNLLAYSEDFSTWTNSNTADTAAQGDAPNGFRAAADLTASANNGYIYRDFASTTASAAHTGSIWIKRNQGTNVTGKIRVEDTNAATSTDQAFTATDTWQRIEVTHTMGGVGAAGRMSVFVDTSAEKILVWGAQAELGSTAGHYIRTDGATASLTYPDYDIVGTAGQYCKGATGEIFARWIEVKPNTISFARIFCASNGSALNNAHQWLKTTGPGGLLYNYAYDSSGAGVYTLNEGAYSFGAEHYALERWDSSGGLALGGGEDGTFELNGGGASTDVGSYTATDTVTTIDIGNYYSKSASSAFHGWLQTLQIWDAEGGYTP